MFKGGFITAVFLLFALSLNAQSNTIVTISGNGTNSSTGNGGLAINATIAVSAWCAFDKNGNLYFTELSGNRIRKISNSGTISKVVGVGNAGYNGDDILADTAKINSPKQIALDKSGNLYIVDAANHRIRKVDVNTGIIKTFAGNGVLGYSGDGDSAIHAQLNYPFGICFDTIGNAYISDYGNSIIRRVDTNGIITLFAGTPSTPGYTGDGGPALLATFSDLKTLCSDSKGNIYVIDWNIRKIDAVTGVITTVAGNSIAGYNGDNIAAISASLHSPLAITVDKDDNLIIADKANNRIRKVDALGIITTIVGTGNMGFGGDSGSALDADINWPEGIAYDSCGNLYINDMQNYRMRKVTFNDTCGQTNTSSTINKTIEITIYPNPISSQLTIKGENIQSVSISNTLGQIVHWQKTSEEKTVLDMSALHAGMYFVTVTDKQGVKMTKKVMKQ